MAPPSSKKERRTSDTAKDRRAKDSASSSVAFVALFVALYIVIDLMSGRGLLGWLVAGTTTLAVRLSRLAGVELIAGPDRLMIGSKTLIVTLECTAIYLIALFASLVVVYPSSAKAKLAGLTAGTLLIFLTNMVRLVFVAIVAEHWPGLFTYVHDFLWQVVFVLIVAGLWLVWMKSDEDSQVQTELRA